VFTRDDLRSIPLFSRLGDSELDYLARNSADLRLRAHEYILHEGEMHRALFVLVDGHIEVTKVVDGTERVRGSLDAADRARSAGRSGRYVIEHRELPGLSIRGFRRGSVKSVAAAVGEGSMAIALIHQYLASA
jgi:CRP-like cAMP-binding protein